MFYLKEIKKKFNKLLKKRMKIVLELGMVKKYHDLPLQNSKRERFIIKKYLRSVEKRKKKKVMRFLDSMFEQSIILQKSIIDSSPNFDCSIIRMKKLRKLIDKVDDKIIHCLNKAKAN